MKQREINERPEWTFWVPDNVADWDAPSHWERERLASMEEHLEHGMVLYDIGTEHGWMSAVYSTFVGPENMVLVEPSPYFWPNIRMVWDLNHFADPIATICAYAGEERRDFTPTRHPWPIESQGEECNAQAYRSLAHPGVTDSPVVTIDWITSMTGRYPHAISIDIEGAEMLALRGAGNTLIEYRPLVWVSIHPDLMIRDYHTDSEDLYHYMGDMGYSNEFIAHDHEDHVLFRPRP